MGPGVTIEAIVLSMPRPGQPQTTDRKESHKGIEGVPVGTTALHAIHQSFTILKVTPVF